jgi:hypothetical protein
MPHLLDPAFVKLVAALPVGQHQMEVPSAAWADRCAAADLTPLHTALFAGRTTIQISRDWLHHAAVSDELRCLAVLLWAYPNGARGHEQDWLAQLPSISQAAATPAASWEEYYDRLRAFDHLRITIISKLACFFGQVFVRLPALILDHRIITVLQSGQWAELLRFESVTAANAHQSYVGYLDCLHALTGRSKTHAEQWELFLSTHALSF